MSPCKSSLVHEAGVPGLDSDSPSPFLPKHLTSLLHHPQVLTAHHNSRLWNPLLHSHPRLPLPFSPMALPWVMASQVCPCILPILSQFQPGILATSLFSPLEDFSLFLRSTAKSSARAHQACHPRAPSSPARVYTAHPTNQH